MLGISDIYASPIFKAREGSTHGYDVVDSNEINPAFGLSRRLRHIARGTSEKGHGLDSGHRAQPYGHRLRESDAERRPGNGPKSEYFNFFDIEWDHPYDSIKGRLLAPFLGKFYGECLESGEIQLRYDQNGFTVNYYELRLPLKLTSYAPFSGID